MKSSIFRLVLAGMILGSCHNESIAPKPQALKLDYYIESFDIQGLGFQPQLKVQYKYNISGKLEGYTVFSYNPNSSMMEEQRSFVFSYDDQRVNKIEGFFVNTSTPYIAYTYQYLPDTRVSKITENNYSAQLFSEANFSYNADSVQVTYTFSNGGSFEYYFTYTSENVLADKTTRGSELCSDGTYSYDQHINPFKDLGYVDYLLTNLSVNNKLTENVNYVSCAFPSLVPQSYTYEYNSSGYPTVATTFYKSGSAKSQKKFFYKSVIGN